MLNDGTLDNFKDLLQSMRHPRIVYISEKDWEVLRGKIHPSHRYHDQDGEYLMFTVTKVRPAIHVMDLSESEIFH